MPTPALHAHEQRPVGRCVAFIMRHKQHEVCKLVALKHCNVWLHCSGHMSPHVCSPCRHMRTAAPMRHNAVLTNTYSIAIAPHHQEPYSFHSIDQSV